MIKINNNKIKWLISVVGVTLLIISTNFLPVGDFLRQTIGYVVEPISYWSNSGAKEIKDFFGSFVYFNEVRDENNHLTVENANLKSQLSTVQSILDENNLIKSETAYQQSFQDADIKIVEAQSIGGGIYTGGDYILINKGQRDGISEGMVVRSGEIFIGITFDVSDKLSKVMLPESKNSKLEVSICKTPDIINMQSDCVKGLMVGSISGVKVENIATNAPVLQGDYILVDDAKVGKLFFAGTLGKLTSKPGDSYQQAEVQLPLSYNDIRWVVVEL